MTEFAATHNKPGKNPSETRNKILEVDAAAKRWEEVMGENLPEQMLKSAYIGIMDSLTRSHLTPYQGKNTSADELKSHILRFVTNAVLDTNAMQVGSIDSGEVGGASGASEHTYLPAEEDNWDWYDINAMNYYNNSWPSKGKGWGKGKDRKGAPKGKGKGKEGKGGKGEEKGAKGKGKGPKGGCFHCGGPHYARNCPKKGKGNGKSYPTYGLHAEENWEQWSHPEEEEAENIGRLSGLTIALGKGPNNPAEISKILPKSTCQELDYEGPSTTITSRPSSTSRTLVRPTSSASGGGASGAPIMGTWDERGLKATMDHQSSSMDMTGGATGAPSTARRMKENEWRTTSRASLQSHRRN